MVDTFSDKNQQFIVHRPKFTHSNQAYLPENTKRLQFCFLLQVELGTLTLCCRKIVASQCFDLRKLDHNVAQADKFRARNVTSLYFQLSSNVQSACSLLAGANFERGAAFIGKRLQTFTFDKKDFNKITMLHEQTNFGLAM